MPKLEAFSRKWGIGSDDFVFSGSIDIGIRVIAVCVILSEFWLYEHELHCQWVDHIRAYLLGLVFLFILIIPIDIIIVCTSMSGTILDSEPRRKIPKLIHARSVFIVLELLWTILGSDWVLQISQDCEVRVAGLAVMVVILGWVSIIAQILGMMIVFDVSNKGSHQAVITKQDWEKRWQNLSCCIRDGSENNAVYSKLANLCSDLFKELDLVPTDTLVGLILVHKQQEKIRKLSKLSKLPSFNLIKDRELPSPLSWMTQTRMVRMMEFAFGSYGWPYFIGMNNPVTASVRLLAHTKCFSFSQYQQIHKDNRCQLNATAFCITTGLHMEDIVYATHHNEIYAIPFYVSIDRVSQSVVIAIRGTLSLEDVITDLGIERASVFVPGVKGAKVHHGMLQSALYIQKTLEERQILQEAFSRAEGSRLVITGHSLGAGTAALLSIILRPQYPDLNCFAFAPPGELVSENMLEYTYGFICSVILGDDVVPRLGLLEARRLKMDVLKALHGCCLPKHEVLASGLWKRLFGKRIEEHLVNCCFDECLSHSSDESKQSPFKLYLQESIIEEKAKLEESLKEYHPLVPPGQILHILETKSSTKRNPEYVSVWTSESEFRVIVLGSNMIAHHFPDTLLDALKRLQLPKMSTDKKKS